MSIYQGKDIMLILGKKYKFTKFEKQRLKKRNIKTTVIRYIDRDSKDVLKEIKETIEKKIVKLLY